MARAKLKIVVGGWLEDQHLDHLVFQRTSAISVRDRPAAPAKLERPGLRRPIDRATPPIQ